MKRFIITIPLLLVANFLYLWIIEEYLFYKYFTFHYYCFLLLSTIILYKALNPEDHKKFNKILSIIYFSHFIIISLLKIEFWGITFDGYFLKDFLRNVGYICYFLVVILLRIGNMVYNSRLVISAAFLRLTAY